MTASSGCGFFGRAAFLAAACACFAAGFGGEVVFFIVGAHMGRRVGGMVPEARLLSSCSPLIRKRRRIIQQIHQSQRTHPWPTWRAPCKLRDICVCLCVSTVPIYRSARRRQRWERAVRLVWQASALAAPIKERFTHARVRKNTGSSRPTHRRTASRDAGKRDGTPFLQRV